MKLPTFQVLYTFALCYFLPFYEFKLASTIPGEHPYLKIPCLSALELTTPFPHATH